MSCINVYCIVDCYWKRYLYYFGIQNVRSCCLAGFSKEQLLHNQYVLIIEILKNITLQMFLITVCVN